MPTLDQHPSSNLVKVLLCGHSGSGKTGSLASLAKAGYRLFIYDFDNGLDVLRDPTVLPPAFHKNVFFKTFTDKPFIQGQMPSIPTAASSFLQALDNWQEGDQNMGGVTKWGDKDVVVVDSLTFMGNAIMRYILSINNRQGKQAHQSDWGDAMRIQEDTIGQLYSDVVKCNVVVTAHLIPLSDKAEGGIEKLYPSALGSKLPPKILRYFNNVIQCDRTMDGRRVFRTVATPQVNLKNSKPSKINNEMPADMAQFFELVRG